MSTGEPHLDTPLTEALTDALGSSVARAIPLRGGDVAESYRIELADGRTVFAKTHRRAPPGFFSTEAAGLAWLTEPAAVPVPQVLAVSDGDPSNGVQNHLVLEWIDEGERTSSDAPLGRALAALHGAGAPCFGRLDRRTTGSRALPNEPCHTWSGFYGSQRLLPLARLARDGDALDPRTISSLERLATRLDDLGVPDEPPARLHGDLWAGNRLVDIDGRSWLIDPAAHGGHREFDLAMMRLFGGFAPDAFTSYDEVSPLGDGWEGRVPLHQIAPLVVHAVKFGGGYGSAATEAINRFT